MWTVYVLKCQRGKFYVGRTQRDPHDRFLEHLSGSGARWTQRFKPLAIVELWYDKTPEFEEQRTEELMLTVGVNKVRGGSYTRLSFYPFREALGIQRRLLRRYRMTRDLCLGCGSSGHFYSSCVRNPRNYEYVLGLMQDLGFL
jgi:predicted GIY-YIG superfamily endonuclease